MQLPDTAPEQVDVIVVGSGASGGWAAKHLCEVGVKVALRCRTGAGKKNGRADRADRPNAARPDVAAGAALTTALFLVDDTTVVAAGVITAIVPATATR